MSKTFTGRTWVVADSLRQMEQCQGFHYTCCNRKYVINNNNNSNDNNNNHRGVHDAGILETSCPDISI